MVNIKQSLIVCAALGLGFAAAAEGDFTAACPASLLQDHPDCTFIVDQAAAGKLKSTQ